MATLQKLCHGNSLAEIRSILEGKPYYITIKEEGNLILFFYDQIKSDFSLPLVQEARGIILEKETYRIVCHPFHKFFNYGEEHAAPINWSSATIEEKLDGSIMKIYFYEKWRVASNSCIEAKDDFRTMFDECLEKYPSFSYENLNKDMTYLFELIHPDNPIVIRYKEKRLVHIGTRNNITGQEIRQRLQPFHFPRTYSLETLEDCLKFVRNEDFQDEGFVVVDGDFHRIKIKSPRYIQSHLIKNKVSSSAGSLECVLLNETSEYLTYFPEDLEKVEDYRRKIKAFEDRMRELFLSLERGSCRKDFALSVKNKVPRELSSIIYKLYDGRQELSEIVRDFLKNDLKLSLKVLE